MIIYIAGPITSHPDYKEKFAAAEKQLLELGHIPINPARLPDNLPYGSYMPINMAMIDVSDAVYLLEGWRDSRGARLEHDYSTARRKLVSESIREFIAWSSRYKLPIDDIDDTVVAKLAEAFGSAGY